MGNKPRVPFDEMDKRIVNYIIEYHHLHGYAPSQEEIAHAMGYRSRSSGYTLVKRLLNKGLVETDSRYNSPRAIRVPGYRLVKWEGPLEQALTLQEPQKAKNVYDKKNRLIDRLCPRCGKSIKTHCGSKRYDYYTEYCCNCGQKILQNGEMRFD